MDRESGKDASSSDTVIRRLSYTENDDKQLTESNTSGEYVTVGGSNSSLDTVTLTGETGIIAENKNSTANRAEILDDKKKKRFGTLKSTFRKEKGIFKAKKKSKSLESDTIITATDVENTDSESSKKTNKLELEPKSVTESSRTRSVSPQPLNPAPPPTIKMMKKKKSSGSLVRKLSLNKFRLGSSDAESRQTPEGGNSSRSSSIESSGNVDVPASGKAAAKKAIQQQQQQQRQQQYHQQVAAEEKLADKTKGRDRKISSSGTTPSLERRNTGSWGQEREKGAAAAAAVTSERRADDTRRRQKSDKQSSDKTISTVTVLQRRAPSVTIRTSFKDSHDSSKDKEDSPTSGAKASSSSSATSTPSHTVSTLPYSLSKWPETKATKKSKLITKSESESATTTFQPIEPAAVEVRRKLSLLEEKRAIFQRKYFDNTDARSPADSSLDTVIITEGDIHAEAGDYLTKRRPSRHINVKTFDTFSTTFEGTYDEEADLGYLDHTRHQDSHQVLDQLKSSMAMSESSDMPRRLSGDSGSTHNNTSSPSVNEKREHLYKILVIGELGAGKTSIIKRYVHQFFSQHYRATIGVDFALKVLNWDPNTIIRLQLWDIAGQERFGNMTRVYYKEAVGAFIVFDVTRSSTLDAVVKWKQDLDSKVQLPDGSPIPCVLLANKCDQQKEGLVNSPGKMDDYCKEKGFAGWFETSAKENINIEEAARFLVNKILQNDQIMKGNGAQDQIDGERFALNQSPTNSKKSCAC